MFIRQPLGRDEQYIHPIPCKCCFNLLPLVPVLRMDGKRSNSHSLCPTDLIPHQRKQWRDQQCRPGASLAQEFVRNEIDRALAPARPLHNE